MTETIIEQYKDSIMPLAEWKALPKNIKGELLKQWRRRHSDYKIRKTWDIPHSQFYSFLNTYKLERYRPGKNAEPLLEEEKKSDEGTDPSFEPDAFFDAGQFVSPLFQYEFKGDNEIIKKKIEGVLELLQDEQPLRFRIEAYRD